MIEKMSGDFLQWLRGFHYVMTLGSTHAAAEAMAVSQPTISHQIKMLERELGVQLFQRLLRRMVPTPAALSLHERSIHLFEQIRSIKSDIGRQNNDKLSGKISLVTTHAIASNYLPFAMQDFSKKNPNVLFTISGTPEFSTILDKVQTTAAEIGIMHGDFFPSSIHTIPIFRSRIALIVSKEYAAIKGWKFGKNEDGSLKDIRELNNMPFVSFSVEALFMRNLNELMKSHGIHINTTMYVNSAMLLVRYVELGFGITIIDAITAESRADIFDIYYLNDIDSRVYNVIYGKRHYMSPQALAFIEWLRYTPVKRMGIDPIGITNTTDSLS